MWGDVPALGGSACGGKNQRVLGSIPSLATLLMFFVYVLKSRITGLLYKGHSKDLIRVLYNTTLERRDPQSTAFLGN